MPQTEEENVGSLSFTLINSNLRHCCTDLKCKSDMAVKSKAMAPVATSSQLEDDTSTNEDPAPVPAKCSLSSMDSVATAIAGVFANFTNKIGKITGKLKDVDKAKSRGVSCQH